MVIEPFAVRLAGRNLAEADRWHADKVLRADDKAFKSGKLSDLLQADMRFHEMIYGWSCNHVTQASMKTNWHHIRRSMAEVLRGPDAVLQIWDEHSEIVECLFDGDAEQASHIMERHIKGAYEAIVELISPRQENELS